MKRKGIILAGGLGTRLFPITLGVTKQLLPMYDKPMIYYPLSTLMQMGIRDVLIIVKKDDEKRVYQFFGDGSFLGMNISYVVQKEPTGIAQAFVLGKEFIGNDHVSLILGDNIFYGKNICKFFSQLNFFAEGAQVFAIKVQDPEKYGVIEKDKKGNVVALLEKPKNPPTNLAVTGLYIYDNEVVHYVQEMKTSNRGEYEITDINNMYLEKKKLRISIFDQSIRWFDTGSVDSLLQASKFVKNEQEKESILIGSVEYIAYKNEWISQEQIEDLCLKYQKSGYGNKIRMLL